MGDASGRQVVTQQLVGPNAGCSLDEDATSVEQLRLYGVSGRPEDPAVTELIAGLEAE